jgi:hypothetical protein
MAVSNLCCAVGLPGAEGLNLESCLRTIDKIAQHVRIETELHYYRFLEQPAEYENSQGYFCILMLITVLQQDCGVRYNPARVRDPKFQDPNCFEPDFSDSRDLFIHGILDGPGGTCASMPVLTVAVGRRLGYPLRLVEAPGHLFARWDDPTGVFNGVPDRFNIDCSGRGFACHSDEHYKTWPRAWTKHEEQSGCYLKSLTPREEIAVFLATRGHCLWDNGRLGEAIRAYGMACVFATHDPRYDCQLCDAYKKYRTEILKRTPDQSAKVCLTIEEQLDLQKAIIRGHVVRLRDGKPGLPLADFGIEETLVRHTPTAAPPGIEGSGTLAHPAGPELHYTGGSYKPGTQSVSTPRVLTPSSAAAEAPAVRAAREHLARSKLLHQFNHENQRAGVPEPT